MSTIQAPELPEWLTVVEAAKLLGVSEKTIRRGVANGAIKHVRPGGSRGAIRIPKSTLGIDAVSR